MNRNGKTEKLETGTSRRKYSGSTICFAVCKMRLKGQRILASSMKNILRKNHHGMRKLSGANAGYVLECCELSAEKLLSENGKRLYGGFGIELGIPNCAKSSGLTPLAIMSRRTLTGSSRRNFAVLMTVIIKATVFCPFLVIFPKDIFLKRTHGRTPRSAKLFVGSTAGYLRKTKSSFLNLINRFRILSDSWCDRGSCWYSFLNLFMMSFLPERYSSGVKAEC